MKKILKWIGIGFVALIVLGIIGSIVGGDDSSSTSSSTETAQTATAETKEAAPAEEVMEVEIQDFLDEFDSNQLAAETKYEKKTIQTTGYVKNISEDIAGSYYVILNPNTEQFYVGPSVQCYFKDKEALVELKNGQELTVKGRVDSQLMNVLVKDCAIVN